eukprot:TRINITY_DN26803_c0_g2_i1.p1 TRINITY_DN26803_c0_g2~~TRINITY_DN26803_c0_g2_i1.p1  ORF type:complete len:901 (+),score=123.32 TRINITY_DN26803_c0_g2_i1:87-2789(+)
MCDTFPEKWAGYLTMLEKKLGDSVPRERLVAALWATGGSAGAAKKMLALSWECAQCKRSGELVKPAPDGWYTVMNSWICVECKEEGWVPGPLSRGWTRPSDDDNSASIPAPASASGKRQAHAESHGRLPALGKRSPSPPAAAERKRTTSISEVKKTSTTKLPSLDAGPEVKQTRSVSFDDEIRRLFELYDLRKDGVIQVDEFSYVQRLVCDVLGDEMGESDQFNEYERTVKSRLEKARKDAEAEIDVAVGWYHYDCGGCEGDEEEELTNDEDEDDVDDDEGDDDENESSCSDDSEPTKKRRAKEKAKQLARAKAKAKAKTVAFTKAGAAFAKARENELPALAQPSLERTETNQKRFKADFEAVDLNGDNQVSFDEFRKFQLDILSSSCQNSSTKKRRLQSLISHLEQHEAAQEERRKWQQAEADIQAATSVKALRAAIAAAEALGIDVERHTERLDRLLEPFHIRITTLASGDLGTVEVSREDTVGDLREKVAGLMGIEESCVALSNESQCFDDSSPTLEESGLIGDPDDMFGLLASVLPTQTWYDMPFNEFLSKLQDHGLIEKTEFDRLSNQRARSKDLLGKVPQVERDTRSTYVDLLAKISQYYDDARQDVESLSPDQVAQEVSSRISKSSEKGENFPSSCPCMVEFLATLRAREVVQTKLAKAESELSDASSKKQQIIDNAKRDYESCGYFEKLEELKENHRYELDTITEECKNLRTSELNPGLLAAVEVVLILMFFLEPRKSGPLVRSAGSEVSYIVKLANRKAQSIEVYGSVFGVRMFECLHNRNDRFERGEAILDALPKLDRMVNSLKPYLTFLKKDSKRAKKSDEVITSFALDWLVMLEAACAVASLHKSHREAFKDNEKRLYIAREQFYLFGKCVSACTRRLHSLTKGASGT